MDYKKPLAIAVKNLTFGYSKEAPIISGASFEVEKGAFIALIGPNGGGKTTLLKLLMGFLTPWQGEISILGKSPKAYPNGIGYVPQNLRFDKQFPITVKELVLEGLISTLPWWGKFSKEDHEKADSVLNKVGLKDYSSRPFGTLSGGQAQRALIARALVQSPDILLLDEPTASVDVEAEADIYEILQTLSKNITILMVTHDIRAIIGKVRRVISVHGRVDLIEPSELCEHFALGLYHYPLIQTPESHLRIL